MDLLLLMMMVLLLLLLLLVFCVCARARANSIEEVFHSVDCIMFRSQKKNFFILSFSSWVRSIRHIQPAFISQAAQIQENWFKRQLHFAFEYFDYINDNMKHRRRINTYTQSNSLSICEYECEAHHTTVAASPLQCWNVYSGRLTLTDQINCTNSIQICFVSNESC